jgi:hypothetical protein
MGEFPPTKSDNSLPRLRHLNETPTTAIHTPCFALHFNYQENAMRALVSLLSFVIGIFAAYPADHIPPFSALENGDAIFATYTRTGCFSSEVYKLKFSQTSNSTTVLISKLLPGKEPVSTNFIHWGNLPLSRADLEGLDKLLVFYRSNPVSMCTLKDEIKFVHYHRGIATTKEQFVDQSCATLPFRTANKPDLTTLIELITRPDPAGD